MQFSTALVAFAGLISFVSAQENPIHLPTTGSILKAGELFNITWGPTTKGPITLLLKKGLSTNLATVGTIASKIDNSGAYSWSVPANTVTGSDYAVEIDTEAGQVNYTPQFTIDGVAAGYSSSSSSASESATKSTTLTTKSSTSTSVIATKSVYGSPSVSSVETTKSVTHVTVHPVPLATGTASAGYPVHTNGTIAISTLKPTGGETTLSTAAGYSTTAAATTSLIRPSPSSPSAAASLQITFSMLAAAFLATLLSIV